MLKRTAIACLLLLATLPAQSLAAGIKIAVVAPLSGNLLVLGNQIRDGARLGGQGKVDLIAIDESCAEKSGPALAAEIEKSGAVAALGFLCSDSLAGSLPLLAKAKIPVISLSIRSAIPMEDAIKKGWPFFRLASTASAEREVIIDSIFRTWKGKPFALLDDGTIMSRELIDGVREALELKGMKAAFIDNFRPAQEVQTQLLRRLVKAGVTHVFAAADRGDMSVMARDAREAKLTLTFMGGDALNGVDQPVPLEPGVMAVTLPDLADLPSAEPVVAALKAENKAAEGYVLPAHAAITVVLEAQEIAAGSGAPLADAMVNTAFETAIGEVRFTAGHELSTNPFRLMTWNGSGFKSAAPGQ